MSPTAGTRTRLPSVVYVLAAGIFLMGTTEFVIAGLLPDVAADLGVDVAAAGILITAFAVGMIVGPPVMAVATLRLPLRATLVGALGVFAAGHVVAALSTSFAVITASRVITALATGTFWAVGAVVAARSAGPGAGTRALAVLSSGLSLAVVLGVPLGTFVGQFAGWRGPFWLLAAAAIVCAVILVRSTHLRSDGRDRSGPSLGAELSVLRVGRMWIVLSVITLLQAGFLGAYSYITPYLLNVGVPAGMVPLALVGFGVGALIGTAVGGRTGDRHPLATVAVAISTTVVLLAVLALVDASPLVVAMLVVVLGASGLGANPVLISQTLRRAGRDSAIPSSLATSAFNLGTALGAAAAGATLSTGLGVDGPPALGAAVAACAFVPLVVVAVVSRRGTPAVSDEATPPSGSTVTTTESCSA